jgi:hypothetical protein
MRVSLNALSSPSERSSKKGRMRRRRRRHRCEFQLFTFAHCAQGCQMATLLKKLHKLFVQQKGSLILLRTFMILFRLFKVTHIPSPLIAAFLSFFLSLLLESA